jgi:hypothetical protein
MSCCSVSTATRRVYEAIRERGVITAVELALTAMADKGIPETDKNIRREFVSRFTNTLIDQLRRGRIERIGERRNVHWKLEPTEPDLI